MTGFGIPVAFRPEECAPGSSRRRLGEKPKKAARRRRRTDDTKNQIDRMGSPTAQGTPWTLRPLRKKNSRKELRNPQQIAGDGRCRSGLTTLPGTKESAESLRIREQSRRNRRMNFFGMPGRLPLTQSVPVPRLNVAFGNTNKSRISVLAPAQGSGKPLGRGRILRKPHKVRSTP